MKYLSLMLYLTKQSRYLIDAAGNLKGTGNHMRLRQKHKKVIKQSMYSEKAGDELGI